MFKSKYLFVLMMLVAIVGTSIMPLAAQDDAPPHVGHQLPA